ncbi:MAG: Minf_1886 family protein [Pirellulales bacterium]
MHNPSHPIVELLKRDKRYRFEAYVFVFEALSYAHTTLGMGSDQPSEVSEAEARETPASRSEGPSGERHLTGQQLCEAIRHYALEQYGYMAKCVLNSWGVRNTGDFGEIVFSLIAIGQMRKTKDDRREDFDHVFDFDTGLQQDFRITLPE